MALRVNFAFRKAESYPVRECPRLALRIPVVPNGLLSERVFYKKQEEDF
jgi:hypothetical protein